MDPLPEKPKKPKKPRKPKKPKKPVTAGKSVQAEKPERAAP